ncbi:unnamed protein product, partial [Rotaria magnacalcarata]
RLPTPKLVEPILVPPPPPPPPPPVPLTTTEITETVRTVRRRPRAKATATIIEQQEPVQRIQTEEVTVEQRRPQVAFEQIEVRSNSISKPSRDISVEYYDTVVVPQQREIIETEIPSSVQYIDTRPVTRIEKETVQLPVKSNKVIKGKKIVGAKVDSWNRGYRRKGGDLKIFDEGLKFKDNEEPIIETYDRNYTKHQGVVQVRTNIDQSEEEEATIEVFTRPFEIEQASQTVSVTREIQKLPTETVE